MKLQKSNRAFTLIELLVVITIIGILATGAVSIYTSQIQKARDSTRITDLSSLRWWIEQFYQDKSFYPTWSVQWKTWSWVDIQDYLPSLAEDPKHNQTCNGSRCWYVYIVWADLVWITAWAYELSTAFENQGNVDARAISTVDNWEDNSRLEIWSLKTTSAWTDFNTISVQGTSFAWAAAIASTNPLVIIKSNVVTK